MRVSHSPPYDVVIVGGGPAGCAAALSLPPGTRGLLVHRGAPDADLCCGGLLAPDAQAALASLDLNLPEDVRIRPEPHRVLVNDLDSGRRQCYQRDYVNLDRGRFDSWLLQLAAERVEVRDRTRFVGLTPEAVLLKSGHQTEEVDAQVLIGADGAGSAVRRLSFPAHPTPPLMIALQARFPCPAPPDDHIVLFGHDLTDFYAWAIPKGDEVLVGCAFHDRMRARESFEQVLSWYQRELALPEAPLDRSGRYLSQPWKRSHLLSGSGNVLLAGEAAGLVSPSSGEGISFALVSGAAAGRAVGTASPADAYAKAFSPLARKIMTKTVKARVIYSPATRKWALRLPWCP